MKENNLIFSLKGSETDTARIHDLRRLKVPGTGPLETPAILRKILYIKVVTKGFS